MEQCVAFPLLRPNTFKLKSYLCRMKSSGEQIDDRIVEVHWDLRLPTGE